MDDTILAAVLQFDDEVLGAPAYAGLLYLASTHHGRLGQVGFGSFERTATFNIGLAPTPISGSYVFAFA